MDIIAKLITFLENNLFVNATLGNWIAELLWAGENSIRTVQASTTATGASQLHRYFNGIW